MATVTITINYDADPPITQAVRDNVDAIFQKCFGGLETDKVTISWHSGLVDKGKLGKNDFNLATNGHIPKANGLTGEHTSTLDMDNIGASSALEGSGDKEITTANTIAHEIGFHALCGKSDPLLGDNKADNIVDKAKCTRKLTTELGNWSPEVCKAMKEKLGVK